MTLDTTQPPPLPPMPLLHPTLSSSPSALSTINHQSNIQFMLFHCQCIAVHCCALLCIEEAKQNTDLTIKEKIVSHHSS